MPAKTVPEFIAYAKVNPGKNMASSPLKRVDAGSPLPYPFLQGTESGHWGASGVN